MLAVIKTLHLLLSPAAERQLDHAEMSQHNRVRVHSQIHGRSLGLAASKMHVVTVTHEKTSRDIPSDNNQIWVQLLVSIC